MIARRCTSLGHLTEVLLALALVLCAGACGKEASRENGAGQHPETAMEQNVAELQKALPLPEEVPVPQAVYKQAYEEALQNMDLDAAQERLREIEKSVARERRALLR